MKKWVGKILVFVFFLSISALGEIITVDDDGPADFNNIQNAIDVANPLNEDEVKVMDGTYTGAGNRDINLNGKNIKVYSANGEENCIIKIFDELDPFNPPVEEHRGFIFHNEETRDCKVIGFTIQNGSVGEELGWMGGGMYILGSDPTIENCKFIGNLVYSSIGQGGAIYIKGGEPKFENCQFIQNTTYGSATCGGGGVFFSGSNYYDIPEFNNCTFTNNTVIGTGDGNVGGAVKIGNCNALFSNCEFTGNSACKGGAFYLSNHYNNDWQPTITDCVFTDNKSDYGGGIYAKSVDKVIPLTGCTFKANKAEKHGGAVFAEDSRLNMENCVFTENEAGYNNSSGEGYGGAVYIENDFHISCIPDIIDNLPPLFYNCMFVENKADYGGGVFDESLAMFSDEGRSYLNSSFIGNSANFYGGAIYNIASPIHLINCVFSCNTSVEKGGALYNLSFRTRPTEIINCTFSHNFSNEGGAIHNSQDSNLSIDVKNSILWEDSPDEIAGFATVTYSNIDGGWLGIGNINENPLFVYPYGMDEDCGTADDNLRLQDNSPCIDAGNMDDLPLDYWDLDGDNVNCSPEDKIPFDRDGMDRVVDVAGVGDPDPAEVVDMGAYEYQTETCIPSDDPAYPLWLQLGMPECWCYDCFDCGDTNGDCVLSYGIDVTTIQNAFPPNPYDPCADLNKDGVITYGGDIQILIDNWSTGCYNCGDCTPIE